jgi:hypothetical protein
MKPKLIKFYRNFEHTSPEILLHIPERGEAYYYTKTLWEARVMARILCQEPDIKITIWYESCTIKYIYNQEIFFYRDKHWINTRDWNWDQPYKVTYLTATADAIDDYKSF